MLGWERSTDHQWQGVAMTVEHQSTVYNAATLAGQAYPNAGGDMIVTNQGPEDYFGGGLAALRRELYPTAVDFFECYLSIAWAEDESPEKVARAHFYAALALLGGSPPRYKMPADVSRINRHLDMARDLGRGCSVLHQASVLWAIVKEDYYEADGMVPPMPALDELRASIGELRGDDIELLAAHVAPTDTTSWRQLARRALDFRVRVEVPDENAGRVVDQERAKAVRKYFNPTPARVTPGWAIVALLAGLGTAALGFVQGGAMAVALLVLTGYLVFVSVVHFLDYLQYRRKYAEAEPKPAESQLDGWLREDLAALTREAAGRLRLNMKPANEGGDLLVPVQTVVGIAADREEYTGRMGRVRSRKGADRRLRANLYDVYILFMTSDLISTYRCELDFATGEMCYDEIREHHYRDIAGARSLTVPMSESLNDAVDEACDTKGELSLAQVFSLSISSGERFVINTGVSSNGPRDMIEVAWRNTHALNVLRKMIRAHGVF
jgi:hypothetical protein